MKRERPGHSLQATALVNEAYMRLVDYKGMHWQNRAHFFAVSAQLMRRILVEHARRHNLKRGGNVPHVSLDDAVTRRRRPGCGPGVARRGDEYPCAIRRAQGASSGNAVLRRAERGRDGGSAQSFRRHGNARLEHGQSLALPRTGRRDKRWTRIAGNKSIACLQSVLDCPPEEVDAYLRRAMRQRRNPGTRSPLFASSAGAGRKFPGESRDGSGRPRSGRASKQR